MPFGKKSIHLMTIQGIPIKLDISWLIIFFLITWTFASVHFPGYLEDNYSLLRVNSINNWPAFINRLRDKDDRGVYRTQKLLDNKSLSIINNSKQGGNLSRGQKITIVKSLNDIIRNRDFYTKNAFKNYDLDIKNLDILAQAPEKIPGREVRKINVELLRAVFPGMIINVFTAPASPVIWVLSVFAALLLFSSILLHEMSHSIVAQKTGLPIKEITLFIFGGVAQMTEEPEDPKQEFMIAIAGPAMSFALAVMFGIFYLIVNYYYGISIFADLFHHLMIINFLMIVFNMAPGLPLDGGRVLRATLWWFTNNLQKSTKIASNLGKGFGIILILLGVSAFIGGQVVGGVWFGIIGLFLFNAAKMSFESIQISRFLEGVRVVDAVIKNSVTVPANITLTQLAQEYFLRHPYKSYPVLKEIREWTEATDISEPRVLDNSENNDSRQLVFEQGSEEENTDPVSSGSTEKPRKKFFLIKKIFIGMVSLIDLMSIERNLWDKILVEELVKTNPESNRVIEVEMPLKNALKKLLSENLSYLVVLDKGELKGILTYRNIMNLVFIRSALVR